MKIQITQEIIDESKKLLGHHFRIECCPINLAASKLLGRKTYTGHEGVFDDETDEKLLKLSPEAETFMDMFDDNRDVEPVELELYEV